MKKSERLIIPSINRESFEEASRDISIAEGFLPEDGWIQLDVSEADFAGTDSWGDPDQLAEIKTHLNVEVHLMVTGPHKVLDRWIAAGVKRVIVPQQEIHDAEFWLRKTEEVGVDLMISYDMSTDIEGAREYVDRVKQYQVLSVNPGPSGQEFQEEALKRIAFLRGLEAGVRIEVDGGVNLETGGASLEAGADCLASGSYIFESENPEEAYRELKSIL